MIQRVAVVLMSVGLATCGSGARDTDPAVTQATVDVTICVPGWSAAHRDRSLPIPAVKGYVRDHIVSLELGGNNSKANLQYQTVADGKLKDRDEDRLHKEVCTHHIGLRKAQQEMRTWKPTGR